jgi:anti-sigma B factor antagonist
MSDVVHISGNGQSAPFDIVIFQEPGRTTVYLQGELDTSTAPRLQHVLDELHRDGQHRIILDLSQVAFLDAAGMRVFVHTEQVLRTVGGALVLTRPTRMVQRILAITELDAALVIQ